MNKKSKQALALAAAVTSLSASLGVAYESAQAAVETAKKVTTDSVKQSTKAKAVAPTKISTQIKSPAANKTSNQIKWEKPK